MEKFDMASIFKTIVEYGYSIRKFILLIEPKDNIGLNAWRMIKETFADFKFQTESGEILSKIKVNKKLIDEIQELIKNKLYNFDVTDKDQEKVELIISSIKLNNEVEQDHFFIQHYRILNTSNFELSPMKLMQVAYNIGQLKAQNKMNKYDDKLMEYYIAHELNNIKTFVDIDNIKLVKDITQKGGYNNKLFYKFIKIDF